MKQESNSTKHRPECPLAHALINKLSTVIGNCDLLLEKAPQDSPLLPRMKLIRDTASSMVADLVKLECDLARRREENKRKAS